MNEIIVDKSDTRKIIDCVLKNGVALIPKFFSEDTIQKMDKELSGIWEEISLKEQRSITGVGQDLLTKNSYKSGKVVRVSPQAYSMIPEVSTAFVLNSKLNQIVDTFYGSPNNKFMQIFAYHDTLTRNEEWVDGVTHSAALHFDPYQSLKFATYLTSTSDQNGMTSVIPGSQNEGKYFRENVLKSTKWKGQDVLNCHEPFSKSKYETSDAICPSVDAGDLLIFDTDAWHAGGEIKSLGLERKAIIVHNRAN